MASVAGASTPAFTPETPRARSKSVPDTDPGRDPDAPVKATSTKQVVLTLRPRVRLDDVDPLGGQGHPLWRTPPKDADDEADAWWGRTMTHSAFRFEGGAWPVQIPQTGSAWATRQTLSNLGFAVQEFAKRRNEGQWASDELIGPVVDLLQERNVRTGSPVVAIPPQALAQLLTLAKDQCAMSPLELSRATAESEGRFLEGTAAANVQKHSEMRRFVLQTTLERVATVHVQTPDLLQIDVFDRDVPIRGETLSRNLVFRTIVKSKRLLKNAIRPFLNPRVRTFVFVINNTPAATWFRGATASGAQGTHWCAVRATVYPEQVKVVRDSRKVQTHIRRASIHYTVADSMQDAAGTFANFQRPSSVASVWAIRLWMRAYLMTVFHVAHDNITEVDETHSLPSPLQQDASYECGFLATAFADAFCLGMDTGFPEWAHNSARLAAHIKHRMAWAVTHRRLPGAMTWFTPQEARVLDSDTARVLRGDRPSVQPRTNAAEAARKVFEDATRDARARIVETVLRHADDADGADGADGADVADDNNWGADEEPPAFSWAPHAARFWGRMGRDAADPPSSALSREVVAWLTEK